MPSLYEESPLSSSKEEILQEITNAAKKGDKLEGIPPESLYDMGKVNFDKLRITLQDIQKVYLKELLQQIPKPHRPTHHCLLHRT